MIRGPKIELCSNEHVDKVFFMVKYFITFYLIQYHKKAFHYKLFLSVYFILQMELHFPDMVKKSKLNLNLWVAKKVLLKKVCT